MDYRAIPSLPGRNKNKTIKLLQENGKTLPRSHKNTFYEPIRWQIMVPSPHEGEYSLCLCRYCAKPYTDLYTSVYPSLNERRVRPLFLFNNIFSSKSALYDVIKGTGTSPRFARAAPGDQVFFVLFKAPYEAKAASCFCLPSKQAAPANKAPLLAGS